jgi:protein-disulfide isomerase
LDRARFEADLKDPSVAQKVAADVESGTRLGVDGTPGVFLNGRRVRHLDPQSMQLLVDHELEHVSTPAVRN